MLGCYVDSDNARGFITAIKPDKYTLHNGSEIPVSAAPIPLWTPPGHIDLDRYLGLFGADPLSRINAIFESWNHAPNLADLPKPTHTEKHGQWSIGAVFKDSKLIQLQITNEHGSWAKTIKAIAATKGDCFSLAKTSIDYAEAVLCHLPDPKQFDIKPPDLSWEYSQDSEEVKAEYLPYESYDRNAGTQQRQTLNPQQVEEYESRYKQGEEAPPAEVYRDPETGKLILKHGFHRDVARQRALGSIRKAIEINDHLPTYGDDPTIKAGFEKELYDLELDQTPLDLLHELEAWLAKGLWCQVKTATESKAVWDSCSDNADNGATRTRADLYRAMDTALRHPKAKGLNDSEIARHVKTTTKSIRKRRGQLEAAGAIAPQTEVKVKRGDKTYTMSIAKMKRPDKGSKTEGHTFADIQALYAPFGEFKRYWDAVRKFVFEWPEDQKCHFVDLKEAHEKFAKVTDGLIKLVDRPQPETPATEPEELPTFAIGDYVRGFDYTDGRRELRGYVAGLGDQTLVLNTGARIFTNGALPMVPKYTKQDDRGQQKEAIAQTIGDAPPEFKSNNYSLVVIDPPWEYNLRETDQSHRGRTPYPAMNDHAIVNLPIANITAADSYCLLWATANHLPLAFKCLEAWGFDHKAVYTWVKTTIAGDGVRIGLGHYGRNCAEFFIVGIKGNPGSFSTLGLTDIPTVIHEAPTEHSVKPEKFYQIAHRLANALGGETIELFARSDQPGWDLWGAEAPTKIQSLEVT
jgi:N6-adenosine-specific RNA methylase IME4